MSETHLARPNWDRNLSVLVSILKDTKDINGVPMWLLRCTSNSSSNPNWEAGDQIAAHKHKWSLVKVSD